MLFGWIQSPFEIFLNDLQYIVYFSHRMHYKYTIKHGIAQMSRYLLFGTTSIAYNW